MSSNGFVTQDTIADMAKDMVKNRTGGSQASAAELYDFMKKVWTLLAVCCVAFAPRADEASTDTSCRHSAGCEMPISALARLVASIAYSQELTTCTSPTEAATTTVWARRLRERCTDTLRTLCVCASSRPQMMES